MAERNRVTPFGEIVAIEQRGLFMGNRGSIHRDRTIVRPWQVRRCRQGHRLVQEEQGGPSPGLPGHRPCALCRRGDFNRWVHAWDRAFGDRPRVDPMDRQLHAERVDGRRQRRHMMAWSDLPIGAYVEVYEAPALVLDDRLVPWSAQGYGRAMDLLSRGVASVLTPPATVEILRHGYRPVIHPTAGDDRLLE